MLQYIDNRINYNYSLCQQCGICEAVCPKQAISFKLLKNGIHKVVIDDEKCIRCLRCVKSCPANKKEGYDGYFNNFSIKKYLLWYNKDNKIRRESSTGGVCRTLIIESLKNNLAAGVYTFTKTGRYPYAEGEFYTKENIPRYDDIPNSVYHSVLACREVKKIQRCERLIVIGTSCQLRAMNTILKGKANEIIRICIFCKQQKTLDSTRFLAKIMGMEISENLNFSIRYRGNGWPGIVRVNESELSWNRAAQIPFGRRLWTIPGCNVCGDSFGTNVGADITLMDPWKIRSENDLGETLVIVHTDKGLNLLNNILSLRSEQKAYKEVALALDLKDIWRKQQLVPFFRGENCTETVLKAGKAEQSQRKFLRSVVETLPRMPILFYRILCKISDRRNNILK